MKNDLTGRRFGKLIVIRLNHRRPRKPRGYRNMWLCRCDCGNSCVSDRDNLISSHTRSCGCFKVEWCLANKVTHGESRVGARTKEYRAWGSMKERCLNPSAESWKYYGAKGIKVCRRWMKFENFLADMGRMPAPGLTVGRIKNELGYGPGNCRWETHEQQTRNYSRNKLLTVNGRTCPLVVWSEESGVPYKTLWYRIKAGWPAAEALRCA